MRSVLPFVCIGIAAGLTHATGNEFTGALVACVLYLIWGRP